MATDQRPAPLAPKPSAGMPIPDEDPRARAAARLAELEAHWNGELPPDMDTSDKFLAPTPPDGWDYQWWPFQVLGKEDPAGWTGVESGGWSAVPLARYPEMMPDGWKGNSIDRDGQRLMERPKIITDRARAREYQKARQQVGDKEAQLAGAPPGTLERSKASGESLVKINRTRESIAIPK
jgi:hypothetical protein